MQELVSDPKSKQIIEFAVGGAAIGRALLLPPKVPAERVKFLRDAFDRMVHDPALAAEAAKRGLELDPSSGVEVQKVSDAIVNSAPALIKAAAEAME